MEYIYHYESPLGGITMASDGVSLIGLWFDQQKYFESTISGNVKEAELKIFQQTVEWLDIYFHGQEPDFTPSIEMRTTEFRRAVWEILLTIPFGQTVSYGEIAARIAEQKGLAKMSAQAVGGAVGHNAVSIIIPCHRVVGRDGSLTGYAGGIQRKVELLKLEKTGIEKER